MQRGGGVLFGLGGCGVAAETSITIFHQIAAQRRTIIVPAKTKGGPRGMRSGHEPEKARKSSKGRRKVIKMDE